MSTQEGQRISPEQVLALWTEYRETGDRRLRDRLVLTFAPMVKYIVYKKIREIPARCDVEDFISCGLEALIRSIDRYDPAKGATLEQFAWTRIHGAVLDELRRHDWAPRSLRRWERDIARANERFIALHRRRPSREELADMVGVTPAQLTAQLDDIAMSDVGSLNSLIGGHEDGAIERIDMLASPDRESDPEHASALGEAKQRFRDAFQRLPERERRVAVLLYVQNMTLREVGDVLGVSESRVCQIHTQLRRTLRTALEDDAALFSEVA
ncbi:MAG: FliA/WhiG family RNA polymerase sigma factor [Solirubrobacteraceae bacterium]